MSELDRRDFVKLGAATAAGAGVLVRCSREEQKVPDTLDLAERAGLSVNSLMKPFDCDVIVGQRNVITADSFWETGKILEAMARFEITQALVYHVASEEVDPQRGNEWVGEEAAEAGAMRPSWVLSPAIRGEWPEPGQIVESLIGSGARAARLFPHAQFFPLSVFMLDDLLAGLEQHRVPLLVHAATTHTWNDHTDWRGLEEICTAFPGLPVVAMRVGLRVTRPLYRMLEKLPNFHYQLSAMNCNFRGIEDVVYHFGSSGIIFGSMMPVISPAIPLTQIAYADVTDEDKRNICGENLRRLTGGIIP